MHTPTKYAPKVAPAIAAFAIYSALAFSPLHVVAQAQMQMPPSQSSQSQAATDPADTQDTQAQIAQLRQQVVQLQAKLEQSKAKRNGSAKGAMGTAKPAMGMEDDSGEMGGMPSDATPMVPMTDEMDAMPAPKGGAAKPMASSGCCGMGMSMGKPMAKMGGMMAEDKMGGMPGGKMPSRSGNAMSGSKTADAPHLLHVGAKDFFLDHTQHLGLTPQQKASLEKIKSEAIHQKATSQRQIDVAEQDLWQLTGADQPNAAQMDSKVQEIAKLKGDQQIAEIHSVTEAADVLNAQQKETAVKSMSAGSSKMKNSAPMKKM